MASKEKKETFTTISLLIPQEINDILERVVKARGEDKSSFIRRLIYTELARLSYLSEDNKKALGVNEANRHEG